MRKETLILFFILFIISVHAQKIEGIITDTQGKPISTATVLLLKAKDSSTVKMAVTKDDGRYSFTTPYSGTYMVSATYIGHSSVFSKKLVLTGSENMNNIGLMLTPVSTNLDKVVVTAKKPMLEVKADKMIMNVEGTINSVGLDALELLRKAPGVNLDNDDNLSISGKNGVQVFIDGRVSPLSGADLSSYLKSIQSSQIESIEIITNPSARFEAAGNGGILNIRLKKNKSFGTNGSVNAGYGLGFYSKYNAGLTLNYRNKKVNLFGTYTYANNRNVINTDTYREVSDSIFDQNNSRVVTDRPHNIKAGIDYSLNKTTTIGIMANIIPNEQVYDTRSYMSIKQAKASTIDRVLVASNYGTTDRKNNNVNLNYRYLKADKELNIDADYSFYKIRTEQYQPNNYYSPANALLYSRIYRMLSPSDISLYSLKMSYDLDFKKGKLSLGGKSSFVNSDNDFARFDVVNNANQKDSLHSNGFIYKENIHALFANYSKESKNMVVQIGLRAENTVVTGNSTGFKLKTQYVPYDSLFKRNYTDLFPSASITFKKDPNNQIGISYSRRIDRPAYQDLNPFEFKVDEYTFRKGNTNLKPQYTSSFGLSHIYKNKLTTTLNYSHIKDVATQIFDTTEKSKAFITKTNLATQDLVSININYVLQYKHYSGFINLNSFYTHYQANFGPGRTLELKAFTYILTLQQSYKFNNGYTAELNVLYNSPGIGLGFFQGKSLASIDAGIQKNFADNRLSLKASVTDIFYNMTYDAYSNFAGQYMKIFRGFEPHLFRANLTYRFGSNQVKAARQRKTGLEDENKRAQGGGG